jgi:PEP-CTERM motif
MMLPRFRLAVVVACGVVVPFCLAHRADAQLGNFPVYWLPAGSSNYNTGANWSNTPGGAPRGTEPDAAFEEVGVIDNGGTATFSAPVTTSAGGFVLGQTAGQTGALGISTGGSFTSVTSASTDGIMHVGNGGRGYLNMTGGSLSAVGLVTAGENVTTGSGLSAVNLSGSSTVSISGAATFGRNLRVTGPSVNFSAGSLTFQSADTFTSEITNSTTQSPLKTAGAANLGGNLTVQFTGVSPAFGQAYNLVDAGAILGNFANLSASGDVPVTGVAAPASGEAYRLHQVAGGTNGALLQLSRDKVLVLKVNRDTGIMSIDNPLGSAVTQLDGYTITSPAAGSLLTSYKGISGAPAGDTGWEKPGTNTISDLSELKSTGSFNVSTAGTSVNLGTGYSKTAVTANHGIGLSPDDLAFEYTTKAGTTVKGQVQYTGTAYTNNLLLTIDPSTGQAQLKNDTTLSLAIDGYAITSTGAALKPANGSWNSFQDHGFSGWQESAPTTSALTELNPVGPMTIVAGQTISMGSLFNTAMPQTGIALKFLIGATPVAGDYNNNGVVDAADYVVYREHLGQTFALPNEDPSSSPGMVTSADYDYWKAHFGATASSGEQTSRFGTVVFASLGPGAGAASAVPEPSSVWLLLIGISAMLFVKKPILNKLRPQSFQSAVIAGVSGHAGGTQMSRRFGIELTGAVVLMSSLLAAIAHAAVVYDEPFQPPTLTGDGTLANSGWTTTGTFGYSGTYSGNQTGTTFLNSATSQPLPHNFAVYMGNGVPGLGMFYTTSGFGGFSSLNPASYPAGLGFSVFVQAQPDIDTANNAPWPDAGTGYFAVQVGGTNWYISATPMAQPVVVNPNFSVRTLAYNPGPGNWNDLSGVAVGASTLTIGSPSAALSGPITGVGMISQVNGNGTYRTINFSNFTVTTPAPTGDVNGDLAVNINDFNIIRDHQQQTADYANGDLNGNGFVDLDDFRVWQSHRTSGAGALAGGSVPEPSTLLLALLTVATVGGITFAKICRHVVSNSIVLRRVNASLLAAIGLCAALVAGAQGAATMSFSTTAPVPGAKDQYDLNANAPIPGGMTPGGAGYNQQAYSDNGGPPGQTFTTPAADPAYAINSISLLGAAAGGSYNNNGVFNAGNGVFDAGTTWSIRISSVSASGLVLTPIETVSVIPTVISTGNATTPADPDGNEWYTWSFTGTDIAKLLPSAKYSFEVFSSLGYLGFAADTNDAGYAGGTAFNSASPARSFTDTTTTGQGGAAAHGYDRTFLVSLSPTTAIVAGDVNGDLVVNTLDYNIIRDHFRTSVGSRSLGDLNADGFVDLKDFRIWKDASGLGAGAGSSVGVPEPASLILAGVGAMACFGYRATRRRRRTEV